MPRPRRIEQPGAIYHVMSRSDRREVNYREDGDGHDYPEALTETCRKTDFQVPACCLMKNHFDWWSRRRS